MNLYSCRMHLLIAMVILSSAFAQTVPATPADGTIILTGKVVAAGSAPFQGIPASDALFTVEVESVANLPTAIAVKKNEVVAILDEGHGPLTVGTRAMFHANVWILSEGIALRATGHTILPATASGTSSELSAAEQKAEDDELRSKLSRADIAILGQVARIQDPPIAAFASKAKRVTEHDPKWKEAVLEVQSWIKGSGPGPHVVVRFPSSRDMAYRSYPKFQQGEKGTFLLHKDQVSSSPFSAFAGTTVPTYTSLSFTDVLDVRAAAKLRAIIANQ